MLPGLAQDNLTDSVFTDSESFGDFLLTDALRRQSADFAHLFASQFCHCIRFARHAGGRAISALCHHVGVIFLIRAKPEVGGIYATAVSKVSSRIVHIAPVENLQTIWNRAKVDFPRGTMGKLIAAAAFAYNAVASFMDSRRPQPAFIKRSWSDMPPKEDSKRGAFSVPMKEPKRFASDVTVTPTGSRRNLRLLSTPTSAVAIGDFIEGKLGLNKLWGMIGHVVSASNACDLIRRRVDARWPVFLFGLQV